MCGLLAYLSARDDAETHLPGVTEAVECIDHRGPAGGAAIAVDGDVVLAQRHLLGRRLPPGGRPLTYADGRYQLIFDGRIYNRPQLRDELAHDFGAQFATDDDGEVLLAAYHYWGPESVARLRGVFAFVIWDRQERRAFGARDPFGVKPLYYLHTAGGCVLASEKKALLRVLAAEDARSARAGDAGMDAANLSHYLTLGYVPEPGTLHRGINRVGSGEYFVWNAQGAYRGEVRRWYRPMFRATPADDPDRLFSRVREAMRCSVRAHLPAGAQVGAFLPGTSFLNESALGSGSTPRSGRLEAVSLVALAREANPEILAFTAGFDLPGHDEVEAGLEIAQQLGVGAVPVTVGPKEIISALPRIVWHLDDPIADPDLVLLYFMAEKAAEQVSVVISGEGGAELFAGHPVYRQPFSLPAVRRLPDPARRGLRALATVIPEAIRGRELLLRATTPIEQLYQGGTSLFTEEEKRRLMRRYDPSVRRADVTARVYAECAELDDVTRMQYLDLYTSLRGDALVKLDRMAMAHSLETRLPFLDKAVFEAAASIPVELKMAPRPAAMESGAIAYPLHRALEGVLPPAVVDRCRPAGPPAIGAWLRDEMYDWAYGILSGSGADGVLDLAYAQGLLAAHRRAEADHSAKLWALLVFCVWYAVFIDRTIDPAVDDPHSALLAYPAR